MGAVQSSSSENGVVWREHKKPVHACCIAMDGTMLLSCSGDKTLKLWSLNDFTFLRQFDGDLSHAGDLQQLNILFRSRKSSILLQL